MSGITAANSSVDKNKDQIRAISDTETGDLNQIRDILFGAKMRQYDAKLLQVESQFDKKMEQLKRVIAEEFTEIKKMLEQSSAGMGERLNAEKKQRSDSQAELSSTLQETSKQFKSRIDQGEQDLKKLMSEQLTRLRKEMNDQHQAAVTAAEQMISELKAQKANSQDLSSLFAEISSRLGETQKGPTASNTADKKA